MSLSGEPQADSGVGLPRAWSRVFGKASAWSRRMAERRPRTLITLAMLVSSAATYLPYRESTDMLFRYWDGPLYMYVAKTLYAVPADHPFVPYGLRPSYFATHLPLYPALIRSLTPLTGGRYTWAMLAATLLSASCAAVLFYELLKAWTLVRSPLWTALLFCLLPPRWLLYHSLGSTEPLFLCLVFAAFLALDSEKRGWVIVFIGLASLTRIVGVLLVPVFMLIHAGRRGWRGTIQITLAFVPILALLAFHQLMYGDFRAYFLWNVAHERLLSSTPLEVFRGYAHRPQFHVTEYYLGTYVVYGLGVLALWGRREIFTYSAVFFLFNCFVFHYDLARLMLPIAPFALLVGFDAVLSRPACRALLPLILYLTYTYAWGFIPHNLVLPSVYKRLLEVLQ